MKLVDEMGYRSFRQKLMHESCVNMGAEAQAQDDVDILQQTLFSYPNDQFCVSCLLIDYITHTNT